jgi:molybdate transport system permease protein
MNAREPSGAASLRVDIEKSWPGFALQMACEAGRAPLGILGASGSGKTLTLRTIAGLENPTRGSVVLNGRVLFDSAKRINLPGRRRRVGLMFQNYALFPHLTVAENIAFGIAHLSKQEQQRAINEQISRAHLAGFERRFPRELSGGQQQRVALARALATNPEVLLLDEPFSALDTHLRSRVEREFRDALANYKGVVLLVSHNLEEVYRICGNLLVLSAGKVVAFGPKEDIFRAPPNLATAQLTGCKNFSRASPLGENNVEAVDWGVKLHVNQNVPKGLGHAAIRAHYIHFSAEAPDETHNVFPGWLVATSESPFRITLYVKLNAPPTNADDYHLQAEASKEVWTNLRSQPFPWSVHLDPMRLFLVPD